MHRTVALLLLLGCAPADRAAPPLVPLALTSEDLATEDLARVDVRGTATAIARVQHTLADLPAEDHAEVVAALRRLAVADPYTRAALQIPFALQATVATVHAEELPRLVQADWHYLQQGLATHVAVLEGLEVDLAVPSATDPLHDPDADDLVDVSTLRNDPEVLARTQRLIDRLVDLGRDQDAAVRAAIDVDSERVETLTGLIRPCGRGPFHVTPGQPWTLGIELAGWDDALQKIRPFVEDPEQAAQVDAMLALLERFGAANFTFE